MVDLVHEISEEIQERRLKNATDAAKVLVGMAPSTRRNWGMAAWEDPQKHGESNVCDVEK